MGKIKKHEIEIDLPKAAEYSERNTLDRKNTIGSVNNNREKKNQKEKKQRLL